MAVRKIIRIDEDKCNGCGQCVNACAEGALKLVNGKARLVRDDYCDGLGACIGDCPTGALTIEEREAQEFDAAAVAAAGGHAPGVAQGAPPLPQRPAGGCPSQGGCPGSMARSLKHGSSPAAGSAADGASALGQWPIQLHLVNPAAPFLQDADILIAASCTAFACGRFHGRLLAGKSLAIACPKLDDRSGYLEKLAQIIGQGHPRSLTVARMAVPCCAGLTQLVRSARELAGSAIALREVVIGLEGEIVEEGEL